MISAEDPHARGSATVNGLRMEYAVAGEGPPIWLLHGNPTYSYIWRNVIPHLAPHGRCVAPDLIGMGGSDKLPNSGPDRYSFAEHRTYLFDLLGQLASEREVVLVLHDWGAALGLAWARENPAKVRGIAMMEPLLAPYTWESFPAPGVEPFQAMRSEAGEKMCLEDNFFVEQVIPMAVIRPLGEAEMAAYRRPYLEPGEGRRPTLSWPRQIPIEGEPADVAAALEANCDWLADSDVPKLFIAGEPGMMVTGALADRARGFPNTVSAKVSGAHYVQEDSPDEIGAAIADWLQGLG